MPVPDGEAGWRELIRSGQPPAWTLLAEASGGSVWKRDGVLAAVVPKSPDRSLFNSVFYRDGGALLGCLDDLASLYDESGVRAWTVWVPQADEDVASGLAEAGHVLDAEPRDMGMEILELREPDVDPELEIVEREDYGSMARINEIAYGHAQGEFAVVEAARIPDFRIYFGRLGGEDVATVGIGLNGSDAIVAWVAVVPEARGRGISGSVLARALSEAREAGLETTTLQASGLGYPVYAKLGYRDYGAVGMWERRRSS